MGVWLYEEGDRLAALEAFKQALSECQSDGAEGDEDASSEEIYSSGYDSVTSGQSSAPQSITDLLGTAMQKYQQRDPNPKPRPLPSTQTRPSPPTIPVPVMPVFSTHSHELKQSPSSSGCSGLLDLEGALERSLARRYSVFPEERAVNLNQLAEQVTAVIKVPNSDYTGLFIFNIYL